MADDDMVRARQATTLLEKETRGGPEDPGLERAKEKGDMYYDQSNATKIERGEAVRQELWNARLRSPTLALSEALRKVETWEDADSSAGGSRS